MTLAENNFYFQLVFANGKSGYVLANQQLSGDGFRTGHEETFSISANRDYGELQSVRIILTGCVAYSNGAYVAAESLLKMNYQGTYNGSGAARIFGISCRRNRYQADSMDAAAFTTGKIFEVLGRPVLLRSAPEVPACMLRQLLANPVILTLEQGDQQLVVSAYTARTLMSFLSLNRAIRRFENQLPEGMRADFREDVSVEKQRHETRKERKARKRAEKWTKKAEKATEKAVKAQANVQQPQAAANAQDAYETYDVRTQNGSDELNYKP